MVLGAHRSTAGGRHKALDSGMEIGCQAVQVFTSSPRQWQAATLTDDDLTKWHETLLETSVELVVAHDSYLINLAAADLDLRQRSIAAYTAELERCRALAIPFLVTHPGAHVGQGEEAGLETFAESLRRIYESDAAPTTIALLETTAGQGSSLGYRFEHLAWLLERLDLGERVAVCADTCHLFAAGYDLRDDDAYDATLAELDRVVGLEWVKVWHLNGSKGDLGSRVERHEQIGAGRIGERAFQRLVRDPRLQGRPMIVETPGLEQHGDNLRKLRRLGRSVSEADGKASRGANRAESGRPGRAAKRRRAEA